MLPSIKFEPLKKVVERLKKIPDREYGFDDYLHAHSSRIQCPTYCKPSFESILSEFNLEKEDMAQIEIDEPGYILFNTKSKNYFHLRDYILKMWWKHPFVQLTFQDVLDSIPFLLTDDEEYLLNSIFLFLDKNSFINYGIIPQTVNFYSERDKYNVLVIGAGLAGISAARRLQYFGYNVTIVEASSIIGGRVRQSTKDGVTYDEGCSFFNLGCDSSLKLLIKQLKLNVTQFRLEKKIFLDGKMISHERKNALEKMFDQFLQVLVHLYKNKPLKDLFQNEDVPIEKTIFALKQLSFYQKLVENLKEYNKMLKSGNKKLLELKSLYYDKMLPLNTAYGPANMFQDSSNDMYDSEDLCPELEELISTGKVPDCSDQFNYKSDKYIVEKEFRALSFDNLYEIQNAFHQLSKTEDDYIELKKNYENINRDAFSYDSLFSDEERQILDWMFDLLKITLGHDLSNKDMNEQLFNIGNSNFFCDGGYSSILKSLVNDDLISGPLEIKLNTEVKRIQIDQESSSCYVTTWEKSSNQSKVYNADFVICTLPLGVLKHSIDDENDDESTYPLNIPRNKVIFDPPLPEDKVDAIKTFGFSTINKVILRFERKFWEHKVKEHWFSNVPLGRSSEDVIVFYCHQKKPYLTGIIYERSYVDNKWADFEDGILVSRCISILIELFGNIPQPKGYYISKWDQNPYFRGSHSYATNKITDDHYVAISKPIPDIDGINRLFFAGEHTIKDYQGTTNGAIHSGLREAAAIINIRD